MKNITILTLLTFLLFFSLSFRTSLDRTSSNSLMTSIYQELKGEQKPDFELFEKAFLGYIDLKLSGFLSTKKEILSIVDFRIPSHKKRFWVIDLKNKVVLYHTYVAHGENSGKKYALEFSNQVNSHKSSLGFYVTQETYIGKNGLSLRLKGLERGFNTNAKRRYVVIHGANYATEEYLKKHGELGNSEGCPAVPMGIHKSIIQTTKEGTCLFIYFPDLDYLEKSNYLIHPN